MEKISYANDILAVYKYLHEEDIGLVQELL